MSFVAPADPIPFRILVDEAMRLARRHFGVIYLPVALPIAVITGALVLSQSLFMEEIAGGAASAFSTTSCFVFLASFVFSMAAFGLTAAVLTAAATDGAAGRPVQMGAEWSLVLRPAVFGTLLLSFLTIMAGFLLLIVPGIYLSFGLTFLVPVMVAEGSRGIPAMKRSWALVFYNPWRRFGYSAVTKIFLLYVITFLIAYVVGFVIQVPFTIWTMLKMARTVSQGGTAPNPHEMLASLRWLQVVSAVLSSFVRTAVSVYSSFGVALLYYDVVRRKEGTDLASAFDARFGAPVPAGYPPPPPPPPPPTAPPA
jgi:hypothetical protein